MTKIDCNVQPAPSAVFLSVPQYNSVFECIIKWFSHVGYDLSKERIMLHFFSAPQIYEVYVLIKLLNEIKMLDYKVVSSKTVMYPREVNWKFSNKKYNNTYVLEQGDSRITVYYEPIIYDKDMKHVNGISLYRNNTVSLDSSEIEERNGHYYVPDYIIKYENNGEEKYMICDAKYARHAKVRNEFVPALSYKYLVSLSPLDIQSSISGMCIIYVVVDEEDIGESFYNSKINNAPEISPSIDSIPLSESFSKNKQSEFISFILKRLLK